MEVTRPTLDATVIGVLTYRRNDDLLVAIPKLLREAVTVVPRATVLIVDNDPEAGAEATVSAFAQRGVHYVHEPRPGIAAARNRALVEAGARFLVFIDDDMHPADGWLAALLLTQAAANATLVAGPVLPEYETEPPAWVQAGQFFTRRRMPTGTPLEVAASGNMLLDLPQIAEFGVRFDDEFGLLGGSDHLFSKALARRGACMVWCDEAITFDRIPSSRSTRAWVLRRAFRSGNSEVLVSLALCTTRFQRSAVRLRAAAGGALRVAVGTLRCVAGVVGGALVHRARGQRTLRRGAGMLAGAFGHAFVEYARPRASMPT